MTEEEYINSTDLCSLRHAYDAISHMQPSPEKTQISKLIWEAIERLEAWQSANRAGR